MGSGVCVALAARTEERKGQVRANNESLLVQLHSRHMACWHAPVGMGRVSVSSCSGAVGWGGRGCAVLPAHAEEREGLVRANDES